MGLTPSCTDVLSEGPGSGTQAAKTEDTQGGGGCGPQCGGAMLADLYKAHSGLKDKQLEGRGGVALSAITALGRL